MPKHKKKLKYEKDFDSANDNDDTLSVVSSTATSTIYQNDNAASPERHDENIRDTIETKLKNTIDSLQEKGYKEREDALKSFIDLSKKYFLIDYLVEQKFTLTEALHRCLKRGKLSEQLLALKSIMLTFIQFGYSIHSDEFLKNIQETLIAFIKNDQLDADLRGQSIRALCLALYITIQMDDVYNMMNILEDIYEDADRIINKITTLNQFYLAALSSWSLLLTIMPINYTNKILVDSLYKFEQLLENTGDVDFRICIGEAIALLYELTSKRRDLNSNLKKFDSSNLVNVINSLIKESSKSTSKKDRRTQHANFRDILKTIEDFNKTLEYDDLDSDSDNMIGQGANGSASSRDFIKVSNQYVNLDNWERKKQYKAFSDLLGTGMNIHLIENEFLRDMFDLGPPVLQANDKQIKLTKSQRASRNKEEFRYRTKDMNKKRENKQQFNDDNDDDDTYS